MTKRSVVRNRGKTFRRQNGRCFYCGLPMWLEPRDEPGFAARHALTGDAAAWLRCTAEHMRARRDGGGHDPDNIAAACLRCNRGRNEMGHDLAPDRYRQVVADAMAAGTWHIGEIHDRFPRPGVALPAEEDAREASP